MQKLKIIFQIFLVVIFIATIAIAQLHYRDIKSGAKYSGLRVNINDSSSVGFINRRDIMQKVSGFNLKQGITPMKDVPYAAIEVLFKNNPYINSAEVYGDVLGRVTIEVEQFTPRMRIIDSDGISYFVDDAYKVVQQRHYINLQLPVITQSGDVIPVKYLAQRNVRDSLNKRERLARARIDLLNDFIEKLEGDDLWKELFAQVNIGANEDVELVPRIGSHLVILCNIDSLASSEKYFDKMAKFYKSQTNNGVWTLYSKVNFKYEGQVVCKKIK